MAVVSDAWTRAMGYFRAAQVASDQMRDPRATSAMKDEATDRYTRAVDNLMHEMGLLSEQNVLGRITLLLAKKGRV